MAFDRTQYEIKICGPFFTQKFAMNQLKSQHMLLGSLIDNFLNYMIMLQTRLSSRYEFLKSPSLDKELL